MAEGVLSRLAQERAVGAFLDSASVEPSGLLMDGEPGIGKTTLWLAAIEQAHARGFLVLSARCAATESVLAYAALADLLGDVEDAVSELPDLQRLAVDRVLLKAGADGPATDPRAVGAGFVSVIKSLAAEAPVLVAIDDLQWLDPSSVSVVAFATRRLSGPVGLLATVRTDPVGDHASWLQLPRPDAMQHLKVPPLSLGGLHSVLSTRLGRSFSRPTMVRIQATSGGNPFYALELGRTMGDAPRGDLALSGTLAELVRVRIGGLADDVRDALLAAACVATPTVELIARATGAEADDVVGLLEVAESQGIIEIDGQRLRFAHPLLATGVYSGATPARRRAVHRHLAQLVDEPELRARHLALAAIRGDRATLQSLDDAAEMARIRGAPAAAAELLDLAIGLGGDTPDRRIRSAGQHFNAGDPGRAREMLAETIEALTPGPLRAQALSALAGVRLFDDSFTDAVDLAKRALAEPAIEPAVRVRTLVTLSLARLNIGHLRAALRGAEDAVTHAAQLDQPHLLSQALGMQAMLKFFGGGGLDEQGLRRALELEDHGADVPVACRPSMCNAQILGWAGHLDDARREILAVRQRCVERGQESELMYVAMHRFQIETWRGNFGEAALVAEDAMERAQQLGGDYPLAAALTTKTIVAAFDGRADDTRRGAEEALSPSLRCGSSVLVAWQRTTLGFLEVSLGNHQAALEALQPLQLMHDAEPQATEIITAGFLPDAIEALISLGRFAEAEPMIDRLEDNGRTLDRPWMLAVGARCRAMLLAAGGDLDAAGVAIARAMAEHERLPMPFERARSQLVLGQLQRRQRHKGLAAATLNDALCAFEDLGTPLWADRARSELERATLDLNRAAEFTPSEQRVAELAASGLTNREVAAAMFISTKTVEANLSRIYRKLDIRSRAELGLRMGHPGK